MQPALSQSSWTSPQAFQEFVPQAEYPNSMLQQPDSHVGTPSMLGYADPFAMNQSVAGIANNHATPTLNPYAQDSTSQAGATYYQSANIYAQPVSTSGLENLNTC